MSDIHVFEINSLSMVTQEGLQRMDISYWSKRVVHLQMDVYRKGQIYCENIPIVFESGKGVATLLLPAPEDSFNAEWILKDLSGKKLFHSCSLWEKPREWSWYVMLSSHIDIGLHNSQYEQRYDCSRILKIAMELNDETVNEEAGNQYRFTTICLIN